MGATGFPKKTFKNVFSLVDFRKNNLYFGKLSSLSGIRNQEILSFTTAASQERTFSQVGFLMVTVKGDDSFGASFGQMLRVMPKTGERE